MSGRTCFRPFINAPSPKLLTRRPRIDPRCRKHGGTITSVVVAPTHTAESYNVITKDLSHTSLCYLKLHLLSDFAIIHAQCRLELDVPRSPLQTAMKLRCPPLQSQNKPQNRPQLLIYRKLCTPAYNSTNLLHGEPGAQPLWLTS